MLRLQNGAGKSSSREGAGPAAFSGCVSLTDITIPASVQKMYKSSFAKCENLTIHAPAGSYAAGFARQNNIQFMPL